METKGKGGGGGSKFNEHSVFPTSKIDQEITLEEKLSQATSDTLDLPEGESGVEETGAYPGNTCSRGNFATSGCC